MLAVGVWLLVDQDVLKVVESDLFDAAAILLIAIGAFVIIVSILGFVGACIEHRTVLAVVSSPTTRIYISSHLNVHFID